MKKQRIHLVATIGPLIVVVLLMVACTAGTAPPSTPVVQKEIVVVTPTPEVKEPVKVCGSAPLTGRFAEPGNATKEGYELWVDVVNAKGGLLGRPVELTLVDDASDQDTAVANYERLITEENCELLVGEFSSALTFPTSAVAERYGMLYITPAGGVPNIYERGFEHIFMAAPSGPIQQVEPYFDFIVSLPEDQQPKRLAVINDDDFFANFVAQGAMQFAEQHGFEVVNQQTFPPETTDYTPIIQAMKSANADAVVMGTAGAQSAIGVMRAAEQLDFHPMSVYQSTGPDQAEYLDALGSLTEGAITNVGFHPSAKWPGVDAFVEAFKEKYGRIPFEDNATGYSVGQVLEFAVNNVGSFDNDALAKFLHTPGLTVMTVQGPIGWEETGFPHGRSLLLQWQNKELEIIWPAGVSTTDYLWPMPWK